LITAITFDFWNTLYQFPVNLNLSRQRAEKINLILSGNGFSVTAEELGSVMQQCWTYADYCQRAKGYDITPVGHVNYILQSLHIDASADLWNQVYDAYTGVLKHNPPVVREGVHTTLPVLATVCKLAVICNTGATPGQMLKEFMKKDGIIDYFSFLVFSDEVKWAKPNIHIFEHALAGIAVNPKQAIHIGDDPLTDVIGAKRAGMKAVWLAPHSNWPVPECDYHVHNVSELLTIIEGENK
jgi:putative hydrolase of the HAD superfamily